MTEAFFFFFFQYFVRCRGNSAATRLLPGCNQITLPDLQPNCSLSPSDVEILEIPLLIISISFFWLLQ